MADPNELNQEKVKKNILALAKLKDELAELRLSDRAGDVKKIEDRIRGLEKSLNDLGVSSDNLTHIYEKLKNIDAAAKTVSQTVSAQLKGSLDALKAAMEDGSEALRTPIQQLQNGSENVIAAMQSALQTMSELQVYTKSAFRREVTVGPVEELIGITNTLATKYNQMIKNAAAAGTKQFKVFDVNQEIADIQIFLNNLEGMRTKMAGGFYASIKDQAILALAAMKDINDELTSQKNIDHDLIIAFKEKTKELEKQAQAAAEFQSITDKFNAKRQIEDEKNARNRKQVDLDATLGSLLLQLKAQEDAALKYEKLSLKWESMRLAKIADEREKAENKSYLRQLRWIEDARKKQEKSENRAYLLGLKWKADEEKKMLKEQEKEQRKLSALFDSKINAILSKMPAGDLLAVLGKLGFFAQMLALAIGSLLYLILKWDALTANIAKNMSITRQEADKTQRFAMRLAGDLRGAGIGSAQIVDGINNLSNALDIAFTSTFASGNKEAERMIYGASVLTEKFGLAENEIQGMVDSSIAMNSSLSGNTAVIEKMANGLMGADKLMKAVANTSTKFLTAFKGSNTQLIGMVSKMKLLGLEVNSVLASNEQLLDIENAISSAFEAQVVTGENIDIDRLMYLQLMGRPDELLDEQLKTLKSADYLNRPGLVQEMLAKSVGMDTEAASQAMIRDMMLTRLGISEEMLAQKQKEGQLVQDVLDDAVKAGKITQKEMEYMRGIADKYDPRTIQEKMTRALEELTTAISTYFGPLTNVLNLLTGGLFSAATSTGGATSTASDTTRNIISGIGGAALLGGLGLGAYKGIRTARTLSSAIKSKMATTAAVEAATAGAATTGITAASAITPAASMTTGALIKSSLKSAGKLGGIGTAIGLGVNLLEGKPIGESLGRSLVTGASSFLGGALMGTLGSVIPGAGTAVGIAAGSFGGGVVGDYLGDLIFGQATPQQYNTTGVSSVAGPTPNGAPSADTLINAIGIMSSKLDTTNTLLNSLNQKPTAITVELDGEKVGKSVSNYSSGVSDRNRTVGNTYGISVDQLAVRPRP